MWQIKNDWPSYILESLVFLVLTINSLHFWWALQFEQSHFLMDELLSTLSQKDHFDCNFWRLIQRFYWYGHAIWKAASMKNFTFFIFNSFEISSENEWVSDSSFIHAYSLRLFHIWQYLLIFWDPILLLLLYIIPPSHVYSFILFISSLFPFPTLN